MIVIVSVVMGIVDYFTRFINYINAFRTSLKILYSNVILNWMIKIINWTMLRSYSAYVNYRRLLVDDEYCLITLSKSFKTINFLYFSLIFFIIS